MEDWENGGFGLYLHWPFCQSKCPYCDFNSHVAAQINQERWARAYVQEIDRLGQQTHGRVLQTVFFGGGTPSLMEPALVSAILERIRATWPMVNDPEITLEANPGSVDAGRFRGYRDAGVNRVSMGFQALNDADLARLGRLHSVAEAMRAYDTARSCFDRVSFDLIYTRQEQSVPDWRAELRRALSMEPTHLSLYQLTIEAGTAFGDRHARGGLLGLPSEDLAADLFEVTQEMCGAAGLPAYEVSNHAIPGQESRHNMIYWQAGDYIGIGPGAHGRLTSNGTRRATEAYKAPGKWLDLVEKGAVPEVAQVDLSGADQAQEYLLMGLRVAGGIDRARYRAMCGRDLPLTALEDMAGDGFLNLHGDNVRTTAAGRPILNAILRKLVVG